MKTNILSAEKPKVGDHPEAILFVPAGHNGYTNASRIFARLARKWWCVTLNGCAIADVVYPANLHDIQNVIGPLLTFLPEQCDQLVKIP